METDWNGLLALRANATIEVLSDYPAVSLPRLGDLPGYESPTYRHLRRRHFRDDMPFLIADVFIDAKLAEGIDEDTLRSTTSMRLAASLPTVKIVNALQTMTIGSADLETADLLKIALNAPVCFVDRSVVDQRGRLVLVSRAIYRGDVFRMDIKLR